MEGDADVINSGDVLFGYIRIFSTEKGFSECLK